MKKIVLTMVALLSMTAVMAQDAKSERKAPKEPSAEEMTNRMANDLKLTDEQKAKFKAHHAKRQEYDKKLKQILTDDQYKSWKKKHGRHGHRDGKRPDKASKD